MWFLRKKKTAKTLELHAQPLKKYVSESIALYKKKQQMQAQADKGIRYQEFLEFLNTRTNNSTKVSIKKFVIINTSG